MKYINQFNTEQEYEVYFKQKITPHIAYINDGNQKLYFQPEIIEFTIDNIPYYASKNMTWMEWTNSKFNTIPVTPMETGYEDDISNYHYHFYVPASEGLIKDSSGKLVHEDDIIIENHPYRSTGTQLPCLSKPPI